MLATIEIEFQGNHRTSEENRNIKQIKHRIYYLTRCRIKAWKNWNSLHIPTFKYANVR